MLAARFQEENFRNFGEPSGDEINLKESLSKSKMVANVGTKIGNNQPFISLIPDFGPKSKRENHISVRPRFPTHAYPTSCQRSHKTGNQLYALLKGSNSGAYECLKADAQTDEAGMLEMVRHIQEIVRARVHYDLMGNPYANILKWNLPLTFGYLRSGKRLDEQDTHSQRDLYPQEEPMELD